MIAPSDLYNALSKAWDYSTSSDWANWTHQLPSWGQCAVTALVVNDYFGGKIFRIPLVDFPKKIAALGSHYFNEINGVGLIDFTSSQFEIGFSTEFLFKNLRLNSEEKTRDYLLENHNTKRRYEILKKRLGEIL